MRIMLKASTFADFADLITEKVKDPSNKSSTFLKDIFISTIKGIDNNRYSEFLHTEDYPWDQGFPSFKDLVNKGDTLQAYVIKRLLPYLQYLIYLFEAQDLLLSTGRLQTRDPSVPASEYPETVTTIRTTKYAFVNQILRVINLPVVEKMETTRLNEFISYLKEIDEGMSQPSPDYAHMGNLYDSAIVTATGKITTKIIDRSMFTLTNPDLIVMAGKEEQKVEVADGKILAKVKEVEKFVNDHKGVTTLFLLLIFIIIILLVVLV